jgi:AraC-like DNA-binding protein
MRGDAPNDFPAIPLDPGNPFDSIRALYVLKEQELLAAIRRGDRQNAVHITNLILVHIYGAGQERSDLLKGLLLELIVMMSRAAIEAGASPSEILALRSRHLSELARTTDDEDLAEWLRDVFLTLFASVEKHYAARTPQAVIKALAFLRAHAGEALSREAVAKHAGVSASHLSKLLRDSTGHSFAELVRESRIEKACEMLARTHASLAEIADACGFCDQSYFTHVFLELKKVTPGTYRQNLAS